jgi:deoxyribodipyrimidine photo-lyase
LSQEFLESPQGAKGIVVQMMKLYEEFGCEILLEAPGVRNAKDWAVVEDLLNSMNSCRDDNDDDDDDDDNGSSSSSSLARMDHDGVRKEDEKEQEHQDPKELKVNVNVKTSEGEREDGMVKRRRMGQEGLSHAGLSSSPPLISSIPSSPLAAEKLAKAAIVLFGSHDVRLHDNTALQMASHHSHVIPVFLWSRKEQGTWGVVGALEVVLKNALQKLRLKLEENGLKLICRMGDDSSKLLDEMCEECNVGAVYWNKEHTTESRLKEEGYKNALDGKDVEVVECQSSLLYDPMSPSLPTGFNGGHWGTLMPFLKGCMKQLGEPRKPIPRHETFALLARMQGPDVWPKGKLIEELDLAVVSGKDKWDRPILERFQMSEEDAVSNLDHFFQKGFANYEKERNRADIEGSTSNLSVHLRIGTLSPRELYYKVENSGLDYVDRKTFSRRLFWRDLAYFHLLNFPNMRDTSIRLHYDQTEWVNGEEEERRLEAWKKGMTGYPLVDAGMRELYTTGWMTQSVRMVVASFLTEYLRVYWVKGCEWFHYTLVDADSAINFMMWQKAGRSGGIDQWNFVMSPVAASQDGKGDYIRKWVPELSKPPKNVLHKPWEAPEQVMVTAGIILGDTCLLSERQEKSVDSVITMRRKNQQFKSDRGYKE